MSIKITRAQYEFIFSDAEHPAYIGGFGSGKTECMTHRALICALEGGRDSANLIMEPSRSIILDVPWPRIMDRLEERRIHYDTNKQELIIRPTFVYTKASQGTIRRPAPCGSFYFRSYEAWEKVIASQYYSAFLDELDTVSAERAKQIWNKVLGRMRQKPKTYRKSSNIAPRSVSVTTTPEGFKFAYSKWGDANRIEYKDGRHLYHMIRTSSTANPWLDKRYVERLYEQYPANLVKAYIDGYFVNLAQGNVYPEFDRIKNGCNRVAQYDDMLYIGMDFNVTNMTATICVTESRLGVLYIVDEIVKEYDTDSLCRAIKLKYGDDVVKRAVIFPDASGGARKTSAQSTDLQIIANHGFRIVVDATNPHVKDRVNSVNWRICDGEGNRRLFVNVERAPRITECLEQQAYKDGIPDKTSGLDHSPETLGYVTHKLYPFVPHSRQRDSIRVAA